MRDPTLLSVIVIMQVIPCHVEEAEIRQVVEAVEAGEAVVAVWVYMYVGIRVSSTRVSIHIHMYTIQLTHKATHLRSNVTSAVSPLSPSPTRASRLF